MTGYIIVRSLRLGDIPWMSQTKKRVVVVPGLAFRKKTPQEHILYST